MTVPTQAASGALLPAALALIDEGATPSALAERFGDAGATIDTALAEGLLDRLLQLGLVRIARSAAEERLFVPTSLGRNARADGINGVGAVGLEELERLRTDLLSTIAHELRTPLTALRTSVGLLADPGSSPTEEQRRILVATIERNADRMQRLIGDILDLARFRSGSIRLQLRRFDACELAASAIATLRPLAGAHDVSISLSGCDKRVSVFGDHRRLEQALVNLVSNAQKFSPAGADVAVRVESGDELVRWRVEDRGPGIAQADRARLFERFFVGRGDRSPAREGVGLGLPTALAIAQAHGGTIDVDSELGRGSTFTLVVPVEGPGEPEERDG
ncbi:MAG TPA: HAMP domain-containing sensor histidine kinase [Candidatus Limnocylindrales bacterium]|nr:HAMP domain-containing sensor histidine kinase [Candidatus Limnocylindrales bacterium]